MKDNIQYLMEILKKLRGENGCPWDREQTHKSILSCLLDETYEYFEAVEENDVDAMKDELGDLLLQVVFHAQISEEMQQFTMNDVAGGICEKLIRRHPHVFGEIKVSSSSEVLSNWEKIKLTEKQKKSLLEGIPKALPALFRAEKVQRKVSRVGFDWSDIKPVIEKVEEEFREFKEAILHGDTASAEEELGDILFSLVNLARHYRICAEDALRLTIVKFEKRFQYIERVFESQGRSMNTASLEELDKFWEESKRQCK